MNNNVITSLANSALTAADAALYGFKAAIAAITENKVILLIFLGLLLTTNKSLSLGKNLKYKG